MSSSSERSDSSDEEVKKSSSSSDSDDSNVNSRSKRASRSKKKTIESGGSTDSDSDAPISTQTKKSKSAKKTNTNKRKRSTDSSDDGRVDDSLFVDAEDKARWKGLTELEKEQEIFERMEARENQRTREEIAQQLEAKKAEKDKKSKKKRKVASESESDRSASPPPVRKQSSEESDMDAEFHQPSDINRKNKEKNAMAELKMKRKEIEKKHAKNDALSIDAVFGAQSSGSSSSSSSSPSSRSSSSSRDSSPEARELPEEKVQKKEVETLEELKRARLSRFKIGKIIHAPFFASTVVGCFIRIGMGYMGGSDSKYKLWQINSVEETTKIYDVEGKRTNKGLKCKHGRQERVFRAAYVSNSEFTVPEFEEWKRVTEESSSLPTMDQIEKKEEDIRKAMTHKYSDAEVDAIIKEKSRFQKVPKNFAMTKAELTKKKEIAQQKGNLREAESIQQEIDDLERIADELDKKRSHDISAIAFINYRNRTTNKNEFLSGRVKLEMNSEDDPFTRKKGGMKVVSGSKNRSENTSSTKEEIVTHKETTIVAQSIQPSKQGTRKSTNISDLHNSACNIDINIDINNLLNAKPKDDHAEGSSIATPVTETKTRGLSLADYRRRKAEAAAAAAGTTGV